MNTNTPIPGDAPKRKARVAVHGSAPIRPPMKTSKQTAVPVSRSDAIAPDIKTQQIPLEELCEAEWNANRVTKTTLAKIRHSLDQFGLVENLVARR